MTQTLQELMGGPVELETDPKRLARNQAFLDWEEKIFAIRRLMRKGQIDESTASSMAEQVSQEYWAVVNGLPK